MTAHHLRSACWLIAWAALASGCAGSARIQFVSLNANEIDPPPAAVSEYDAQEAYWWVDESGLLNIAMRCTRHNPLLGQYGDVELVMSLTPGEPPAGSGRDYKIRVRETSTLIRSALEYRPLHSYAGVLSVIVDDDRHIHGSFRIWMKSPPQLQFFSFVPRRAGSTLCFGTFKAVQDETRGKVVQAKAKAKHEGT